MVQQLKVFDNPNVATAYANRIVSLTHDGTSAVVTFGELRWLPDLAGDLAEPKGLVVNDRVAMTEDCLNELYDLLGKLRENLRQRRAAAMNVVAN
jgi:hypothetical protein